MDSSLDFIISNIDSPKDQEEDQGKSKLADEFEKAYSSLEATKFGASLAGFFSTVKEKGKVAYEQSQKELIEVVNKAKDQMIDTNADKPHSFLNKVVEQGSMGIKELEKLELQADQYIEMFGHRIGGLLKETVKWETPGQSALQLSQDSDDEILYPRSRLEAQLQVIHKNHDLFKEDPSIDGFANWREGFNIDASTNDIAEMLDDFPTLRKAMEGLVPSVVSYSDFWCRYLFLHKRICHEEDRRAALLTDMQSHIDEDVAWDDENDLESEKMEPMEHYSLVDEEKLLEKAAHSGRPSSDSSYDIVSAATTAGSSKGFHGSDDTIGLAEEEVEWE